MMQLSCQLESGIFVKMDRRRGKSSNFQHSQRFFCQNTEEMRAKSLKLERNREYSHWFMLDLAPGAEVNKYANGYFVGFYICVQQVVF